jgi:predicted metal-dependent hydrolase
MTTPDARLLEGVRLFNRQEFFDAHEVVEDLWNETTGPERDLLKGFIQAAVACEHHRRGNPRGRRSVGTTATGYLRASPARALGLDVAGLAGDLESFLDRAERGEESGYPVVRCDFAAEAAPEAGQEEPR